MQEDKKFIITTADLGVFIAAAEVGVDLEAIKNEFGLNFNTLIINNKGAVELSVKLNGRKVAYIGATDSWAIDWEDGLIFDDVRITNEDAAAATVSNTIRISVGRTGIKKNGI